MMQESTGSPAADAQRARLLELAHALDHALARSPDVDELMSMVLAVQIRGALKHPEQMWHDLRRYEGLLGAIVEWVELGGSPAPELVERLLAIWRRDDPAGEGA